MYTRRRPCHKCTLTSSSMQASRVFVLLRTKDDDEGRNGNEGTRKEDCNCSRTASAASLPDWSRVIECSPAFLLLSLWLLLLLAFSEAHAAAAVVEMSRLRLLGKSSKQKGDLRVTDQTRVSLITFSLEEINGVRVMKAGEGHPSRVWNHMQRPLSLRHKVDRERERQEGLLLTLPHTHTTWRVSRRSRLDDGDARFPSLLSHLP